MFFLDTIARTHTFIHTHIYDIQVVSEARCALRSFQHHLYRDCQPQLQRVGCGREEWREGEREEGERGKEGWMKGWIDG